MAGVLDATYQYFENQFTGSREDIQCFNIYRRGSHLGHVTQMPRINYRSPYNTNFGFDWPIGFRGEGV